ncbi:hypothetical protein OOT33_12980 [Sphingobium sp. DEHP117]|uniref:hypothetical protein n=1 Tax=Sphingobium sp. DEHP117 TaxID=2993436 RepID=UPI0027D60863|nr:hypothetical protein [Sphingobium sp. DEHP117]MDQ4421336.1 hypothetical protein [Sphingobium sp. DEHP117]
MAAGVFLLIAAVLFAGMLPLVMPLGLAAGGVLETGQIAPTRWWLAGSIAVALYGLASWRMGARARRWWLGVLVGGMVSAVLLFGWRGARDQPEFGARGALSGAGTVGLISALPLFWAEGAGPGGAMTGTEGGGRSPLVDLLKPRAVDHIDAASLRGLDSLVLAQPRLLQPAELVAFDAWVRGGGRAVIFADPLLAWPSELPLGDPRRPPLTSLLDPLMLHWGLALAPVREGGGGVERRMLGTGHVVMLAGASRFLPLGKTACALEEDGLMALCRIGKGRVRLIADADVLDDRLWLADPDHPGRREAHASDIISLLAGWAADPLAPPRDTAPRRVTNDAALIAALRWGLLAGLGWAGLGWFGLHGPFARKSAKNTT